MSESERYQFNRRNFLPGLGAGLAASAVAPQLLFSAEARRSSEEPIILGAGNHKYEWGRGWGKLPEGMRIGCAHGDVVGGSDIQVPL